jgi:flagellin-specific chaperone FliS
MSDEENEEKLIAFVRLKGPRDFSSQVGWVQMQVSGTDNFVDLLRFTLVQLVEMNVLDNSQMFMIRSLPCRVYHYPTRDTKASNRVSCTLVSACASLPIARNRHVQYFFDPEPVLEKKDPFAVLMQTQHRRLYPNKYEEPEEGKSLHFNLQLFNYVVDCLTTMGCSVTPEQVDAVKSLVMSIRDVLQMSASRIPNSKLPATFCHELKPFKNQDRTSQDRIKHLVSSLQNAVMNAHPFLETQRWKKFKEEVSGLQDVLNDYLRKLRDDSIKAQDRHNRTGDGFGDRLADVKIMNASETVASKYR